MLQEAVRCDMFRGVHTLLMACWFDSDFFFSLLFCLAGCKTVGEDTQRAMKINVRIEIDDVCPCVLFPGTFLGTVDEVPALSAVCCWATMYPTSAPAPTLRTP